MYGSFRDLFKPSPSSAPIPASMLDFFNSEVPDGFHYSLNESGELAFLTPDATPTNKEIRFEGAAFKLSEDGEKAFEGRTKSQESVFTYLRNAQEHAEIVAKRVIHIFDGQEFAEEELAKGVGSISGKSSYVIYPPEPNSFSVDLSCPGANEQVEFTQLVTKSAVIERFIGTVGPLSIELTLNHEDKGLGVKASLQFEKSKSACDFYRAALLYRALSKGTLLLGGHLFGGSDSTPKSSPLPLAKLSFWAKAAKVEELLDVSFDITVPATPVTIETIELLYASRYCGKALKMTRFIDCLEGKGLLGEDAQLPEPDEEVKLITSIRETKTVFGQPLDLIGLLGIYGVKVSEMKTRLGESGDGYRIAFEKTEHTYQSVMLLSGRDDPIWEEGLINRYAESLEHPITSDKMLELNPLEGLA